MTQNSFKKIVTDGGTLGIAAVGANPNSPENLHNIALFDVSDPSITDAFQSSFPTPGRALALAIYNGLAYVADEEAGLQVLNYRSQDLGTVAPMGNLSLVPTGTEAIEGAIIALRANVTDDVQMRNVEFFANGQRIATDGDFPFEVGYRVPQVETGRVEFTAIARDTAGNATDLGLLQLDIVEDTEPPMVELLTDLANATITDGNDIIIELDITDNISVRTTEIAFELDGELMEATRLSANQWFMASPGVGHYEFRIRAFDGANNAGFTDPTTLKVRKEAISREVSGFFAGPASDSPKEAISREASGFNAGSEPNDPPEAISREVSAENQSNP